MDLKIDLSNGDMVMRKELTQDLIILRIGLNKPFESLFVPSQMMKMTEEIMLLMERLQKLHQMYKSGEYTNFSNRFSFEIHYWYQFRVLTDLINQQIMQVKPFHQKEF